MTKLTLSDWHHLYEPGDVDHPVLLTLHGTGGSEVEIAALGRALDERAGILSVRGRVSENGMPRWFARRGEGVFDLDDVERRAGELAHFLELAREAYGLGDREVVAVGFSNGANIALATVLLHPESLTGVVAFSGMYPLGDRIPTSRLEGRKIALVNGNHDPMAPATSVDHAEKVLVAAGANVTRLTRDGGHGIAQSDLTAARNWIASPR